MDIYLLRDGKEMGPFTEDATHSFLSQGTIVMDDLAWTPGLAEWSPLERVLYPQSAQVEEERLQVENAEIEWQEPEIETPAPAVEFARERAAIAEPATEKQKAFLSYFGIPFTNETTKEQAALLVNEAMENPSLNARVLQWNDDRLRLHPEIFAAELQAKKEDRANRFCEACQREGAEFFTGVTKAHCQVLVGYLDVNFPNWDAHEADAARNYFFPAVAEKFPQLVHKEWREKLRYKNHARASAGDLQTAAGGRRYAGMSPMAALVRGAVFGLALLLVLYDLVQFFTNEPEPAPPVAADAKTAVVVPAQPAKIASEPAKENAKPRQPEPEVAKVAMDSAAPADSSPPDSPPADPTPRPTAPKTRVVIARPIDVKLHFGSAKLNAGTELKIVTQDATTVTVIYGAETVTIPIDATDLAPQPPAQ